MQHHPELAGPELSVRAGFRRDQVTYDTFGAGVLLVQVPGPAGRACGDPDLPDEARRQDGREDQEVSSQFQSFLRKLILELLYLYLG